MAMIRFFLAAAALAAVWAPALAATAEGKLRVLVVTGGHDFERAPFFRMWDGLEGISWREVQHPAAADEYAPEKRGSFDVIALYDMPRSITEAQQAWLLETLREGKGLVVLHHALGGNPGWPEYARIVGGKYLLGKETIDGKEWPPSTFQHDVPLTVRVADARHPITKGLTDFPLVDEVYGGVWVSPRVHPLLKVSHPKSSEVVGWTHSYMKARVVCLQPGHGSPAFEDDSYCTLLRRALLWAARRL